MRFQHIFLFLALLTLVACGKPERNKAPRVGEQGGGVAPGLQNIPADLRQQAMQACGGDAQRYCAGVKPLRSLLACMKQNFQSLSAPCRTFIEQNRNRLSEGGL